MADIHGAIFDLDGTLFDSMPIYDTVTADMLRDLGYAPRAELREQVRSLSGMQVLEHMRREYNTRETAEELESELDRRLYDFYAHTAPLKPGVPRLLEALKSRGIPMAVATATNRIHVEAALERTGIAQYFKRVFTCSEERTGKTDPKIFLTAAEFLGSKPEETLVFEDAIHAVRSAVGAGFRVIAVRDAAEENNREEMKALAERYLDTLEDFELELR
ncbi:MAG: HAD family phosphatase [Oscillospiraceae bacterium]|nr:HAD family phosphatase [Oscillospiraceae bacterium]